MSLAKMSCIIVDTSVIVDMFLTTSSRHPDAKKILKYLNETQKPVRIPMFALFEIHSALQNIKINLKSGKLKFYGEISLDLEPIPIDQDFIKKYLIKDLPYLKAADLIFVAMAKVDGCILITEDKEQYNKSKSFGVKSYRIEEFLNDFVNH